MMRYLLTATCYALLISTLAVVGTDSTAGTGLNDRKEYKGRALEGYLIDAESAKDGKFLELPDSYTVGEARSALQKNLSFTVLVPQHSHAEILHLEYEGEVDQDGDTEWQYLTSVHTSKMRGDRRRVKLDNSHQDEPDGFGWLKGKNPREQREARAKEKTRMNAGEFEDDQLLHRRCKEPHTIDHDAVASFLATRHPAHDNYGKLKVRVVDKRPSTSSAISSSSSSSFRGMHIQSGTIKVEGYLADIYCVNRVRGLDGANMITNPQGHSKHCNVFAPCVPDGYTILTPVPSTATAYGPMYNLTSSGNTAALSWMDTLDEWQRNLLVTQTGRIDSNGKFEIVGASDNTFGDKTSGSTGTTSTTTISDVPSTTASSTPLSTTVSTTPAVSGTSPSTGTPSVFAYPSTTPMSTGSTQSPNPGEGIDFGIESSSSGAATLFTSIRQLVCLSMLLSAALLF